MLEKDDEDKGGQLVNVKNVVVSVVLVWTCELLDSDLGQTVVSPVTTDVNTGMEDGLVELRVQVVVVLVSVVVVSS